MYSRPDDHSTGKVKNRAHFSNAIQFSPLCVVKWLVTTWTGQVDCMPCRQIRKALLSPSVPCSIKFHTHQKNASPSPNSAHLVSMSSSTQVPLKLHSTDAPTVNMTFGLNGETTVAPKAADLL